MKMLTLCNYVPKDMLRCQFYTCKTDEWFGKFVFIVSLQADGITSSPPAHSGQQFTILFAFPKSILCLRIFSQSILLTSSLQARVCI